MTFSLEEILKQMPENPNSLNGYPVYMKTDDRTYYIQEAADGGFMVRSHPCRDYGPMNLHIKPNGAMSGQGARYQRTHAQYAVDAYLKEVYPNEKRKCPIPRY